MLISYILDPSIGVEWRLMVLRGLACVVFGAGIICLAIRGLKGLAGPNSVVRKRKMLGAFMMIAAVCGAIKPDGGTNSPSGGPPQQQQMMMVPRPLLMMPIGETVSELDVERGYRLDGVATNDASAYAAPSNAVYDTEWSAFGGATDSKTYDIGFDFPLGTNVYRKLNVTQNTSVRKRRRTDDVLLRVSEAISGMRRGVSSFSTWGDGARRIFNWTDCVGDPTTNLFNESAQLEVRPNGDFTVRSNELAFAYRRITPFDWDDDGLANEIDPAPRTNGGDFYGQSDAWVLANFTNAEEILSVGYTNWIDGQVGTGLANGLYKFTASFTNAPGRATLLSVGGLSVVVTNAGDYVFLLDKGVEYTFETKPFLPWVEYSAVDDIPAPRMMLLGGTGVADEGADWTIDGGELDVSMPDSGGPGRTYWYPTLTAGPGIDHHMQDGDFPMAFSAHLTDYRADLPVAYHWSSGDDRIQIAAPSARETSVTVTDMPGWWTFSLYLDAYLQDRMLSSYLTGASYGTNDHPTVSLALDAPQVLFLNDDNRTSRVYRVEAVVTCPVATNVTVTVSDAGEPGLTPYSDSLMDHQIQFPTCQLATSSDSPRVGVSFFVSAENIGGGELKAVCTLADGTALTNRCAYRIIEPLCKLVNTTVTADNRIVNPSRLVYGTNAWLEVGVNGSFAPSEVAWSVVDGPGRIVSVEGWRELVEPTSSNGTVVVEARFGDDSPIQPRFVLPVVELREIEIRFYMVNRYAGVDVSKVLRLSRMLERANLIYSQIGLHFSICGVPETYNRPEFATMPEHNQVTNTSGVVKNKAEPSKEVGMLLSTVISDERAQASSVYFMEFDPDNVYRVFLVDEIIQGTPIAFALHDDKMVVVGEEGSDNCLAHEFGHLFGLNDIFARRKFNPEIIMPQYGIEVNATCFEDVSVDWWNETGRGFYEHADSHGMTIERLLMDGFDQGGIDIPSGRIKGYPEMPRHSFDIDFRKVGNSNMEATAL